MNIFTPARQLILDALRPDGAAPQLEMSEAGWAEFAELARMHRLGPMLHHRLADSGLAIPQQVREQLQASHRRHAMRNLNIYRELVTVARLLEDENIPFIALKGAYLAQFSYPEPGLRPMRDLDLLLRPEQAVQAFELLRANGYRSMFEGLPEAHILSRRHLSPLTSPGGINIELHHRLTDPASHRELQADSVEGLWGRSIMKMVGGVPVRFLCPEDMLLHLCIHATMEHLLNLGPLSLADVALLAETHSINWTRFLDSVSGGNWQRCVLPLLYLAQRHLGADVPGEVIQVLGGSENDTSWLATAEYLLFSDPADHRLLDYDVQEILYSGKFSERLSRLAGAVFPPRSVIARHFPVSADSPMAFLYYPRRWYRLISGKLPALLRAHVGRKQSLRELAEHRSALCGWLKGKPR